jgi:hypothetical protein
LPPKYPQELLWKGRQLDPAFQSDELLYYRVEGFDVQGKVNVDEIRAPDTSVNRGKYSRPEHVLYASLPKYLNFKVAQFQVREIPKELHTGDGRAITFRVEHDPTIKTNEVDENYAHSEIRAFEGNERKKNISQSVLKQYRIKLRNVMAPAELPASSE